jgi:outer membrane protein, adhesin transport system
MKTVPIQLGLGFCLSLMMCLLCDQGLAQPVPPPPLVVAAVIPDHGLAMKPLQALVLQALDRSPSIREAQANWRATEQDVNQSRSALWPRLEFNANSSAAKLEQGKGNALSQRAGATVSYNVLDFGKTRKQIEARQFQALAYQDRVLIARETTTFDTVSAYLQLIKHQRLIRIYEQHIIELRALVDKLSEIVAVFEGRRSELTQAQTRLGQARDALLSVKARQREFQLVLMRQTGAGAASQPLPDTLPTFPASGIGSLIEEASLRHPAVRSARSEAASARALAAETHAGQRPQVDLQLNKQTGVDANGISSPAQIFVSARWVAFEGFAAKASEQAQLDRAQAADERASQLLIEIEFNVETAWADYEAQSSRVQELTQLVKGTAQVRKDYYDQWRELGRRSLLDVLTAENEHLSTKLSLATSEVDQAIALAKMRFEAGTLKEWIVGDDGQAVQQDLMPVKVGDSASTPALSALPGRMSSPFAFSLPF